MIEFLCRSKLNVVGFLNTKTKDFFYETNLKNIKSDFIISIFNKFIKNIKEKTFVVLDNASIHKSKKFKENIKRWENQGLYLFYLPTYSPELNKIEILWREMKYRWFSIEAFKSNKLFIQHIKYLLKNFGIKYDINFC